MAKFYLKLVSQYLLFGPIFLFFSQLSLAAESVGKIEFASANVTIVAANGTSRLAAKGMAIEIGDTIRTADGPVQFRMIDGAYFSLQPKTEFRVDDYRQAESEPEKSSAVTRLLKGGLRTVTGLIGKKYRKSYRLDTPTSTIGIRGTAFSATTQENGDSFSVSSGGISVCSEAGCLDVDAGQSAFVPNRQAQPQLTTPLQSNIGGQQPSVDRSLERSISEGNRPEAHEAVTPAPVQPPPSYTPPPTYSY